MSKRVLLALGWAIVTLTGCGGGGGTGGVSSAQATSSGGTASPAAVGTPAAPASAASSSQSGSNSSASMPADLVYADAVPNLARQFTLGPSRWLVSNVTVERSAWRMASDSSNAYVAWMEYDTRSPGGFSSTAQLKVATVTASSFNVAAIPPSSAASLDSRSLALAAGGSISGALAVWVERAVTGLASTEWRVRAAESGSGAAPTAVAAIANADQVFVDKLHVLVGSGSPEIYYLKQYWTPGAGTVASSELWRATRTGSSWSANLVRTVTNGTIDDLSTWGGDQPGIAWVETVGTQSQLLSASPSDLANPQVVATGNARAILDLRSEASGGTAVLAWRGLQCAPSTATGQGTAVALGAETKAASSGQGGGLLACLTIRTSTSSWQTARTLGSLLGTNQDNLALALRPTGEAMVIWSSGLSFTRQVAMATCTSTSCAPAQILANADIIPMALTSVAATSSGFAAAWADVDPYDRNLTAMTFARFTPAGDAVANSRTTVRGVFYGSGMSPATRDSAIAAVGDRALLGWRIERFNTDSTSDLNATWIAQ